MNGSLLPFLRRGRPPQAPHRKRNLVTPNAPPFTYRSVRNICTITSKQGASGGCLMVAGIALRLHSDWRTRAFLVQTHRTVKSPVTGPVAISIEQALCASISYSDHDLAKRRVTKPTRQLQAGGSCFYWFQMKMRGSSISARGMCSGSQGLIDHRRVAGST